MTRMDVDPIPARSAAFEPLLFTVAYEILGSAVDADHVVRHCLWDHPASAPVDAFGPGSARAHLIAQVARRALETLTARRRVAMDYVGPWLPDPIRFDGDVLADAGLAEFASTAMLLVLEELEPAERTVYVLSEVFGFADDTIATMMSWSLDEVGMLAERGRSFVERRRPRFDPMDRARAAEVVETFLDAAESGDADALIALMAPEVVLTSDSNGKTTAVRQPMRGAPAVMQVLSGFARIGAVLEDYRAEFVVVNGQPGMILYFDGRLQTAITLRVVDGLIGDIYVMRNPDKLVGVELRRPVTR